MIRNIAGRASVFRMFSTSQVAHTGLPEAPSCGHHTKTAETVEDERPTGPTEQSITNKIQQSLSPSYFDIRNDSWMHRHHREMQGVENLDESHFSMVVVSDKFHKMNMPARHRYIYKLLSDELENQGLHAIQMKTKTPEEWERELARAKEE